MAKSIKLSNDTYWDTSAVVTDDSGTELSSIIDGEDLTVGSIVSKNMFPLDLYVDNTAINQAYCTATLDDDVFTLTATSTYCYMGEVIASGSSYANRAGALIDVSGLSSITYTLSNTSFDTIYITAYDSSKVSLGYTYKSGYTNTYTIPSGASYITFRFGVSLTTSGASYSTTVQIEKGNTATDYTKHINFENNTEAAIITKTITTSDSTTLAAFASAYKSATIEEISGYTPILCYEVIGDGNAGVRGYSSTSFSNNTVGCWVVNFSGSSVTVSGFNFKILYLKNKI